MEDLWRMVHAERAALINDLKDLDDEQWEQPSLCGEWTVHDVVAHLVDTARTTRIGFVVGLARARFDFDRQNANGVLRERGDSPQETLERLGQVASPPGSHASGLRRCEGACRPCSVDGSGPRRVDRRRPRSARLRAFTPPGCLRTAGGAGRPRRTGRRCADGGELMRGNRFLLRCSGHSTPAVDPAAIIRRPATVTPITCNPQLLPGRC